MERKPNKYLVAAILVAHAIVVMLTWRDIGSRTPEQVRGSKRFWRVFSALNTGHAALYWILGRRRN